MWRHFWNKLKKSPSGLIGGGLILFWLIVAAASPAPYSFTAISIEANMAPPGLDHWLGTDQLGRDILSRIIVGSRSIMSIGLLVAVASTGLGTMIGFAAAYIGGWLEEITMRLMDILMSLPAVVLAMVFLGIVPKAGWGSLIMVISLVFIPRTSRVARGALLEWKTLEFVDAAKIRGESGWYIITREILPNTLGPILVEGTARFSYGIMTVASLGFLGVGLQPPTPDWGMMVAENKTIMSVAPWAVFFPALAIGSLILGVFMFTDFLSRLFIRE